MSELGRLLDGSHASCRDDYECSSARLDALIKAMKDAGALGARVTGAGWGGCAIALVPRHQAGPFLDRVWNTFYASEGSFSGQSLPGQELPLRRADVLFETRPSQGATALLLDDLA